MVIYFLTPNFLEPSFYTSLPEHCRLPFTNAVFDRCLNDSEDSTDSSTCCRAGALVDLWPFNPAAQVSFPSENVIMKPSPCCCGWDPKCRVIVREGDFPDSYQTSDHRPVELRLNLK